MELENKGDLASLIPGDIIKLGFDEEKCLVYPYAGVGANELFCLSRLKMSGIVKGGINVIYNLVDDFDVRDGCFWYRSSKDVKVRISDAWYEQTRKRSKDDREIGRVIYGEPGRTSDGLFAYGIRSVVKEPVDLDKDWYVLNPKKYAEFDEALARHEL